MTFNGADIQIDAVQHTTSLIGHGHQTMNDQTRSQFDRNHALGQTTFAGRVQHAALGSSDAINARHRSEIMPRRESFEDSLRSATNTYSGAQDSAASAVASPGGGIAAQINP